MSGTPLKMRPEARGSGRAVSIQVSPTQRGSTGKSHAMKLKVCPFRVSARSKTLGSGEIDRVGSSRDGQKTVHVSLDDRCHWEMRGKAHGRWLWWPAVTLQWLLLSTPGD